jgi:hypothetical protein
MTLTEAGAKNQGANYNRILQNEEHGFKNDEKIFQEEWVKESAHLPTLIKSKATLRDRAVAATIVQWLGTGVGTGFLIRVLDKCGYEIVSKKDRITRISNQYGL